jgi:hypothetical protein
VNTWFYFDAGGVFRILILQQLIENSSAKRKKVFCNYYFENDKMFYKKSECLFEAGDLLTEANRLKSLASSYLKN